MSNSTGTGSNGSRMEVPQAKDAMDKFKMEVAGELGVNLKSGYNGDLTSAEAGSIGGRNGSPDDPQTGRTDVRSEIIFRVKSGVR